MWRNPVLRGVAILGLIVACGLSRSAPAYARSISFRGGPEDHFWDVEVTFCKDGFKVAANEIQHPPPDSGFGDDLPYSLVITTTAPLITTPLPATIGQRWPSGAGHPLASATGYYAYAVPQPPTTSISITLERWEHGDLSVIDTGEESPGDDRDSVSGQVANCTLLTPPVIDTPPSPANGAVYAVLPGQPVSFPVEGSDADGIDNVTLSAAGLPPGASFAIPPAGNPAASTLSWTPTAKQTGTYPVKFSATDASGRTTPVYSVTILVGPKVFAPLVRR
jgi:hypothetical protein